jgi:hypothetical protein
MALRPVTWEVSIQQEDSEGSSEAFTYRASDDEVDKILVAINGDESLDFEDEDGTRHWFRAGTILRVHLVKD